MIILLIILSFSFITCSNSADILVIFPTTAQSHYRVIQPLIHSLLDRGHSILSITNFPDSEYRANLSHIDISRLKPHTKLSAGSHTLFPSNTFTRIINNLDNYGRILNYKPVVKLLQSKRKFDLVIVEIMTSTPIFTPIAGIVNAPIIGVCPMFLFPWIKKVIGEPEVVSYMPNFFPMSNYTTESSVIQRSSNTLFHLFYTGLFDWLFSIKVPVKVEKHYGIRLSTLESMSNISLILLNSHLSIFPAVPHAPGIIEIGGIHIVDVKPIPKDLEEFIDDSKNGIIIFSLGSIVSEDTIGQDKLDSIFNIFSMLKERIIMKLDLKNNITSPSNVKIVKWLPQRDLLAHPKVLLFISHGGLMSVFEAVHCGKPIVGIPIFGDQPANIKYLVYKKVAVLVSYENLGTSIFNEAIQTALSIEFRKNMKQLQQLYFDRPQSPLQTALFWTEYVLKNENSIPDVLKTKQIYLNWFQTYLLDISVTLTLICLLTIYFLKTVFVFFNNYSYNN